MAIALPNGCKENYSCSILNTYKQCPMLFWEENDNHLLFSVLRSISGEVFVHCHIIIEMWRTHKSSI